MNYFARQRELACGPCTHKRTYEKGMVLWVTVAGLNGSRVLVRYESGYSKWLSAYGFHARWSMDPETFKGEDATPIDIISESDMILASRLVEYVLQERKDDPQVQAIASTKAIVRLFNRLTKKHKGN